jgi:hypothetical protein
MNNKQTLYIIFGALVVALIAIIAVKAHNSSRTQNQNAATSQTPAPAANTQIAGPAGNANPVPPPPAASLDSGIQGKITIGPTCPGPLRQDQIDQCADKPYQTTINVETADGAKIITKFTSAADGTFKVALAPGTYLLTSASSVRIPSFGGEKVTVAAHKYSAITLMFDSGLR